MREQQKQPVTKILQAVHAQYNQPLTAAMLATYWRVYQTQDETLLRRAYAFTCKHSQTLPTSTQILTLIGSWDREERLGCNTHCSSEVTMNSVNDSMHTTHHQRPKRKQQGRIQSNRQTHWLDRSVNSIQALCQEHRVEPREFCLQLLRRRPNTTANYPGLANRMHEAIEQFWQQHLVETC